MANAPSARSGPEPSEPHEPDPSPTPGGPTIRTSQPACTTTRTPIATWRTRSTSRSSMCRWSCGPPIQCPEGAQFAVAFDPP